MCFLGIFNELHDHEKLVGLEYFLRVHNVLVEKHATVASFEKGLHEVTSKDDFTCRKKKSLHCLYMMLIAPSDHTTFRI